MAGKRPDGGGEVGEDGPERGIPQGGSRAHHRDASSLSLCLRDGADVLSLVDSGLFLWFAVF